MKAFKLFSLFVAAVFSVAAVKAQTADEIVGKHIDAVGGAANWKKVTSMVLTGTMSVNGTDVSVVSTVLQNKGSRQDISVMGMAGYIILTPTAGWNFMPFQGQTAPEPMTAEDVKEGQDDLDAQGNLIDYKTKGHTVELIGSEDVEGTDCFKLKLGLKSGRSQTYFIDKKTYNLIKTITVRKANGQEMEVATTYSNFQKLPEGIIVPMSSNLPIGPGMNVDMTITKVEVNKTIDEAIFKPSK
jgi:lipopolysaccharide export system protein LptA